MLSVIRIRKWVKQKEVQLAYFMHECVCSYNVVILKVSSVPKCSRQLADIEWSSISLPGYLGRGYAGSLTAQHSSDPRGYRHIERPRTDGRTH